MNEDKTPRNIMIVMGVLLLGLCAFTIITYQAKKNLEEQMLTAGEEIGSQQELIDQQQAQLTDFQIELDHRAQNIERLNQEIEEKVARMEQQDAMLRELETRNEKLLTDFNSLVRTGASPDTQKFMDDLTAEIVKTRNQRDSFRIARNELIEANEALKRDLQQQLQEVDYLKRSQIPKLQDEIAKLQQVVANNEQVMSAFNVRASVQDVDLDVDRNAITFNLSFSDADLRKLQSLKVRQISFVPVIVNQESDLTFTIEGALNPEQTFSHLLMELQPSMRQSFVINNVRLSDTYRKRNAVNYEKGDRIELSIQIPELNNLIIAQKDFRLR